MKTQNKLFFLVFISGMIFLSSRGIVSSTEIFVSPSAKETGSWSLSILGQTNESEPILEIKGGGTLTVPLSAGSIPLSASSTSEVKFEQEFSSVLMRFDFRPKNGLLFRSKLGMIREFDLEYSSGSHVNKFSGFDGGLEYGGGFQWYIVPGSMVTLATAIDFSWTHRKIDLDRFESNNAVSITDHRWEQDIYQAAVNLSYRFNSVQPYGGCKIFQTASKLKSLTNKEKLRGDKEGISPFIGVEWEVFQGELFLLEASFLDEKAINAGLTINF